MSEPASISAGIAARYATAIFEMAKADKKIPALQSDLDALESTMSDSPDFNTLISSPMYSREQQAKAVASIAAIMKLSGLVTNSLGLMAAKHRLFVLPHLARALRGLIAIENGEVTAKVTAAKALTKAQQDKLGKSLKATFDKDVKISMAVDESLIGGLIVQVGSKMIDTSIRSKLNNLQNAMKEVG